MADEPKVTPPAVTPPAVTPPDDGSKGPVNQEAIDRIFKKQKETEEALERSEREKVDLVGRVKSLEEAGKPPAPAATPPPPGTKTKYGFKPDGSVVYPATQEEWEDLYDDNPLLATDLRVALNTRQGKTVNAQLESIDKVAKGHPEMFKKDEQGNILKDARGIPVPDIANPKYKRYCEIAAESGVDAAGSPVVMGLPDGPEIVALKLEKELYKGKEAELTKKAKEEADAAELARKEKVKAGGTAPPGGAPPAAPKKTEVTFNSASEKAVAEEKVASGKYTDLEEYCRVRDSKEVAYGRGGV